MGLDLADFENRASNAVKLFWGNRNFALEKQASHGAPDSGSRGAVTAGKNMDGFLNLAMALIEANGLRAANVHIRKRLLTLPGFFRPTKTWDMLVIYQEELVAVLEFKSQVGPSFGNNFNNRAEEVIGSAHDLRVAHAKGAFGIDVRRPFLGWLMLLEDCPASRRPTRIDSPHFPVRPEFDSASYAQRYDLLCKKIVQMDLYASSALILSPRSAINDGYYREMSPFTSLRAFVASFAGHISTVASR